MNFLALTFLFLNVITFVLGWMVNFLSSIIPKCIVQLFRYGRANASDQKPHYLLAMEVPKRWFWHFYLYAVFLQLSVIITVINMYSEQNPISWLADVLIYAGDRTQTVNATVTIVAIVLFQIHLCRRLYETLFVSIFSNTKMNILHYLLGYIHYTCTILSLVAHSPLLASFTPRSVTTSFSLNKIGSLEILGVGLFLTANYLQNRAHVGLASLRKGKDKKAASGHQIPRGGLFEFVSSPNYFTEILIYIVLSSLHGFQNESLNYCTFWVICNQVTAAIMNHQWYQKTFKDYPTNRKAIIPFIL